MNYVTIRRQEPSGDIVEKTFPVSPEFKRSDLTSLLPFLSEEVTDIALSYDHSSDQDRYYRYHRNWKGATNSWGYWKLTSNYNPL